MSDQIGAPTSARLIADVMLLCLKQAISERLSGEFSSNLYHLTASGNTSWFVFTEKIVRLAISSLDKELKLKELNSISTSDYPTPAARPKNSRLNLTKLESHFRIKIPDWKSGLRLCLDEIE